MKYRTEQLRIKDRKLPNPSTRPCDYHIARDPHPAAAARNIPIKCRRSTGTGFYERQTFNRVQKDRSAIVTDCPNDYDQKKTENFDFRGNQKSTFSPDES